MHTKIVITGSGADAVGASLGDWAAEQERMASFETLDVLDVQVVVGTVNHLDEESFKEAVRRGAADPQWKGAYWPVTVVLEHEDARGAAAPSALRLDTDGHWSR